MIASAARDLLESLAVLKASMVSAEQHDRFVDRRQKAQALKEQVDRPLRFLREAVDADAPSDGDGTVALCKSAVLRVREFEGAFAADPVAALG